ncbi:PerC family transcriptional regulator [Salmonella enterica]|uniref:PerC family transcriptional regulator n=1 Tax=Salmonella enterica TaxID=28901 RepID=UPI0002694FC9|nr:PerC family transcriptional regulator [Salmonella enterica]EDB9447300.1 PerC family transcriptional regulator [Salmonella enterica subsp. enterica serovar Enteritidis]EBI5032235.1 PerC family transcriptional regulator [Salmonella enterica]EBN2824283.1 PerC family transcriptional regulator [Salmonella enterica]ECU1627987.1 PerC family transcriptional regulator [Salmonella enterica]EDB9460341.1 PerC family transcriptional regulator [Salmonella enterica subsp. enterica serovar Enteritidis]
MGRKKTGEYPTGRDAVAEALEAAGLYRRAARRWLEVLDRCCDSEERAWLAARRSQCLVNARKPEPPAEYFEDVYQAASDTQKRMGIHAQNRFRRYPSAGESRKKPTC